MTAEPVSASIPLKTIAHWNEASDGVDRELTDAFEAEDYLECIRDLWEIQVVPLSYINSLDKIIDSLPTYSELRERCMREFGMTCSLYRIFPTSYEVTSTLTKPGEQPFASGRFSDIWKLAGLADREDRSPVFAVKTFHVPAGMQDVFKVVSQEYFKAVIVSKRAIHPNVLVIEGVAQCLFRFCVVSKWMAHGNILDFVETFPTVNRLVLLIGVTRGLNYLHGIDVVHGNLKCPNILIDAEGNPRLTDFGLWPITENIAPVDRSTSPNSWALPYSAPELVLELRRIKGTRVFERKEPTNKSDVYSLSMVIVELVTGKAPYTGVRDDDVNYLISNGLGPIEPRQFEAPGMTTAVWKIAKRCWHRQAGERPEVNAVLRSLERIADPGDERAHEPFTALLSRLLWPPKVIGTGLFGLLDKYAPV